MDTTVEVWEGDGGWYWQVIENTNEYKCELACAHFPCISKKEAKKQAERWIIINLEMPDYEPANCYIPGYGWTVV